MVKKKLKINSLQELQSFAQKVANCLKGREVILLKGNLASGKTTFTRYLLDAVQSGAGEQVNSPTFSVMNEYETDKFPVYHVDLYRVKSFDLSDVIGSGVVIVEWPEKWLYNITDVPVLMLEIRVTGENERIFEISVKNGEYLEKCLK
ncbi:tRNA (adenosine(37)-N6)-threonylcarbamoyltransferase complex ATPase subunit type 1 TsaE [Persephonella sp.]